jgi:hypothetical protein
MQTLDDFFNMSKPVVQEQQSAPLTEFRPNPKKGQNGVFEAVVRFLPNPKDPANKSIITKYYAYIEHPTTQVKKNIDCPSTVGQPDPIQNTFFALRNAANPVLQENSKQFSRKQQSVSLIQVISCKSDPSLVNKILVWKYGVKILEKLNQEMNPPMGDGHNPFNLFTGRPFSVQVKEVSGFPNYDACQFFDLAIEQSGMRIVVNNAQGQPQVAVVTTATIATEQGKTAVFNYLKENAPDTDKYEYHPWTTEETEFVNECIRIYSNPQASIQAKAAAANPGLTQVATQPMSAQVAAQPQMVPQMPAAPQQVTSFNPMDLGGIPQTQAPAAPAAPVFGLDNAGIAPTSPAGFQPTNIPDVDALLNQGQTEKKEAPAMALDLNDVLSGQIL